jgi:hypothetical protein
MKSIVFRYGFFAIIAIICTCSIHYFILMRLNLDWQTAEVAGYLTMTLAMVFVFFGMRHYRDKVNNGSLSFGEGLKVGLLIALGPALFFALFDLLYVEVINPNWSDEYYSHYIEQARKDTPAADLPAKLKEMQEQKEFWSKPHILFLLMFITTFIIGAIVTIISALTLRRKERTVTVK